MVRRTSIAPTHSKPSGVTQTTLSFAVDDSHAGALERALRSKRLCLAVSRTAGAVWRWPKENRSLIKHSLLMLACCLVPLALFAVFAGAGISLGGILPFAMALLCHLMMFLMMRGMMGHDHSGHKAASDGAASESCHGEPASTQVEPAAGRR